MSDCLQVKSLYGPLLAIVQTSKSASEAMVRQHSPDGTRESMVAAIRGCPEGPEGVAYRCRVPSPAYRRLTKRARSVLVPCIAVM